MEPNEPSVVDPHELHNTWSDPDNTGRKLYDFARLESLLPGDLHDRREALYRLHEILTSESNRAKAFNVHLGKKEAMKNLPPHVMEVMTHGTLETECRRLHNMITETEKEIGA